MPLRYVIDADAKYKNARARVLSIEDALNEARREGHLGLYSFETMWLMLDAQQDRGDRISTTTLLSECDRNLVLERMTEYAQALDDLWASFRGTMFHSQLERAATAPDAIAEKRYYMRLPNGETITCQPDIIRVDLGIMRDYKTVKNLPRWSYPYHHHCEQLKVNRYIVDNAYAVEWEPGKPEPVEEVEDRIGRAVRPAQWTKLIVEYIHPNDGPKPLVVTMARPDGKRGRVPDLGDDAELGLSIWNRYNELRAMFEAWEREGAVPGIPKGWEALSGWLCVPFCGVRQDCLALQAIDAQMQAALNDIGG